VIKTFADRHTQEIYTTGRSRRLPPDIWRRARRKLEYVDVALRLEDLKTPPGDREGQHAIRINDQWRICFRFEDGDAFDVEITDYH
jgi:toxin HigB-1